MIKGSKKDFNDYEIREDITVIFLRDRSGKIYETIIDTKNLEKIRNLNLHWHTKYDKCTKKRYVEASERYENIDGKMKGRPVYLHEEIANPDHIKNICIDHKDYDPMNNLEQNLRISTIKDNVTHRENRNSNNSSGYRNVSFYKGWYLVQLQVNGKNKILKKFKDVDEAGKYAEKMRKEIYGEYSGES